MTTLEILERQETAIVKNGWHAAKLAAALAPDPAAWEYRGECFELEKLGECACGHAIRLAFPIYRGSETKLIGSTCINHYASVAPDAAERMNTALEAKMLEIAEIRRKAKETARQEKVQAAVTVYDERRGKLQQNFESYRRRGLQAPYEVWWLCASRNALPLSGQAYLDRKGYTSQAAMVRKLSEMVAQIDRAQNK